MLVEFVGHCFSKSDFYSVIEVTADGCLLIAVLKLKHSLCFCEIELCIRCKENQLYYEDVIHNIINFS